MSLYLEKICTSMWSFALGLVGIPDLFLDLIKPETGGINLHSDQRVYLRCIMRFVSVYGVFPRGWSKTYNEYLAMFLVAMFFPGIDLAMTAQTKENASDLIEDKHTEIMKHFPMLKNEVDSCILT